MIHEGAAHFRLSTSTLWSTCAMFDSDVLLLQAMRTSTHGGAHPLHSRGTNKPKYATHVCSFRQEIARRQTYKTQHWRAEQKEEHPFHLCDWQHAIMQPSTQEISPRKRNMTKLCVGGATKAASQLHPTPLSVSPFGIAHACFAFTPSYVATYQRREHSLHL